MILHYPVHSKPWKTHLVARRFVIHNIANYWFNVQVGGGQTVNQAFVFHLHSTVASITLGVTPISGHMIMQSVPHLHCAGSHPIPETHVCEEHVLGTSYPSQLSYHFGIGFARRLASSYQVCVCFCVCCVGGRAGCCRAGGGQAALAADKFGLAVVKQGLVPLSGCCVCTKPVKISSSWNPPDGPRCIQNLSNCLWKLPDALQIRYRIKMLIQSISRNMIQLQMLIHMIIILMHVHKPVRASCETGCMRICNLAVRVLHWDHSMFISEQN